MRIALISKAMTVISTHSKAELLSRECDLMLITPESWTGYGVEEVSLQKNFEHIKLPIFFPGKNHFHMYKSLKSVIETFKPDIIHIDEEPYSLVTLQTIMLSRKINVKVVAFTWQNIFKNYPIPFSSFENYVYKNADAIIAGNSEAAVILRRKGYKGLTPIIPQFGIQKSLFSSSLGNKKKFAINPQCISVAYVGRLVPEKGLKTLLEAFLGLKNMILYIVGTGSYEKEMRNIVSTLNLSDKVKFLGGLGSLEVPSFMASVDILVLPSLTLRNWKEQFGRVLVEAMASGTVVVGSDSGEIPNVIGDAGVVFPEGDVNSLRLELQNLVDVHKRERLIEKGLLRASEFSQEKIVEGTLSLYRKVLSI